MNNLYLWLDLFNETYEHMAGEGCPPAVAARLAEFVASEEYPIKEYEDN